MSANPGPPREGPPKELILAFGYFGSRDIEDKGLGMLRVEGSV